MLEKIKDKMKSIQFRLFVLLCISTILAVFTIIMINNIVLETFYKQVKADTAKSISSEINEYYNKHNDNNNNYETDINDELSQLEIKNNIEIFIKNEKEDPVYLGNKDIINSIAKRGNITRARIIFKNNNTEIRSIEESISNNYMLLFSKLDNGYSLYIKIPTTPIKESVDISNKTLLLISLLMIIISACLASIISRKFTNPIIRLNRITEKLAKLDFSEKYEVSDTDDEINTLGKNINEMSDKLEITIGQLRKNNDELEKDIEEKSKIDEMRKQFISDVSHELKTPISLIQGYAEGLLENVNTDEESRKFYAEVILDESNKMDKMVKELLELMKLEYQERKFDDSKFDLREVIKEEIRRETVVIQEKSIIVEFDDKKSIPVYADQSCIEQIVNNYLTNAIKHCEEKNKEKKISIRTEKTKENKIRLYVFNTGERISEDYINKIWGRFYKVDSSRNREEGGTGIGLALVKAIMNNYNNEYGVKNLKNGVEFFCDINCKKEKRKDKE